MKGLLGVIGFMALAVFLLSKCPSGAPNPKTVAFNPHGDESATTTPDPRRVLLSQVGLIGFSWRKEAFDTVMVASFAVTNPTEYGFRDFEVTCTHSGPSGTRIDSN